MRTIPAGRFKAQCLRFLDEVANTGEAIVSRNIYATVLAHDGRLVSGDRRLARHDPDRVV